MGTASCGERYIKAAKLVVVCILVMNIFLLQAFLSFLGNIVQYYLCQLRKDIRTEIVEKIISGKKCFFGLVK